MSRTTNSTNGAVKTKLNGATNGSVTRSSTNGTVKKKLSGNTNGSVTRSSTTKGSRRTQSHITLEDLFAEELKDIYNAEKQLVEALPEMAAAAYSEDLQDALNKHLSETKRQMERIEKIFERLDINTHDEVACQAMKGLIRENEQIMDEYERSPVRDSALIIGVQKIEHYEIASYGSLCELADVLGYMKIADTLERSLREEEETDRSLTSIAQDVNDEAYEASHETLMI